MRSRDDPTLARVGSIPNPRRIRRLIVDDLPPAAKLAGRCGSRMSRLERPKMINGETNLRDPIEPYERLVPSIGVA
jgi:hypothetical protein